MLQLYSTDEPKYKDRDKQAFSFHGKAGRKTAKAVLLLLCGVSINPFLPTGQFMAPKLIILIKCLIDVLFFKVLF